MSDSLKKCAECAHLFIEHFTAVENGPCLKSGCSCKSYVPKEGEEKNPDPPMFSVRIDKHGDKYTFQVEPIPYGMELIALDSAPGVIAFVQAPDPGAAAQLAWERGERELASLGGLPPSPPEKLLELLGDKG